MILGKIYYKTKRSNKLRSLMWMPIDAARGITSSPMPPSWTTSELKTSASLLPNIHYFLWRIYCKVWSSVLLPTRFVAYDIKLYIERRIREWAGSSK